MADISPGIVTITSTITVNLVCDAIDERYQPNTEILNQTQQGYILYTFNPQVPHVYLIIQELINAIYLR